MKAKSDERKSKQEKKRKSTVMSRAEGADLKCNERAVDEHRDTRKREGKNTGREAAELNLFSMFGTHCLPLHRFAQWSLLTFAWSCNVEIPIAHLSCSLQVLTASHKET